MNRTAFDDYRRAVHDSDGSANAHRDGASGCGGRSPIRASCRFPISPTTGRSGFGLMQRARTYDEFEDAEAKYERRPSLWIEPIGDWGEGVVELVEIPTDREINDNVVAYWRPKAPYRRAARWRVGYRMRWTDERLPPPELFYVVVKPLWPELRWKPPPVRRRFSARRSSRQHRSLRDHDERFGVERDDRQQRRPCRGAEAERYAFRSNSTRDRRRFPSCAFSSSRRGSRQVKPGSTGGLQHDQAHFALARRSGNAARRQLLEAPAQDLRSAPARSNLQVAKRVSVAASDCTSAAPLRWRPSALTR